MSATTKHPTKAKGMNFTTRKRISSAITSIVMIAIALICAIPLWYIVINTFKTIPDMSSNPLGLPKQWTFDNYTHAFATVPILRSLWNTLIVTFFGVAIQVIVGALAAYGMILRKSRFTAIIGTILMVAFVVPAQSTLIPLYRMEAQTHIVNTLGAWYSSTSADACSATSSSSDTCARCRSNSSRPRASTAPGRCVSSGASSCRSSGRF